MSPEKEIPSEKEILFAKKCDEYPEIMLFHIIDQPDWTVRRLKIIQRFKNDMAGTPIPYNQSKIDSEKRALDIAIKRTERFGVKEASYQSEEFGEWFKWWKNYWQNLLVEERKLTNKDFNENKNLDKWRPSGDWQEKIAAKN